MFAPVLEVLIGFGISYLFGGGTLFVVILGLSFFFPSLFKVLWYMIMGPLFLAGFAFAGWLFLPMLGIGAWSADFYKTMLIPAILPTLWACSPAGVGPGATYL